MDILVTSEGTRWPNGVTSIYDPLVDLLESIDRFLNRLDIYTRIPPTPEMDEMVMAELLSTLALATKERP